MMVQGANLKKTPAIKSSKLNIVHEDSVYNKILQYTEVAKVDDDEVSSPLKGALIAKIMSQVSLRRHESRPDLFSLDSD